MTMDFLPVILYPLGALAALCTIWIAASYFVAKTSGWQELYVAYPSPTNIPGKIISNVSAKFKTASYSGVLRSTANDTGVRFEIVRPFNFGSSPIFIP